MPTGDAQYSYFFSGVAAVVVFWYAYAIAISIIFHRINIQTGIWYVTKTVLHCGSVH